MQTGGGAQAISRSKRARYLPRPRRLVTIDNDKKRSPSHAASRRWGAKRGRLRSVAGYELRSICARNSAIEPNLTVPSASLASIDPSV